MEHSVIGTIDTVLLASCYLFACMITALYLNHGLLVAFRYIFGSSLQGCRYAPIAIMFFFMLFDLKIVRFSGLILGLYSIHLEVMRMTNYEMSPDCPVEDSEGDWVSSPRQDSGSDQGQADDDSDQDADDQPVEDEIVPEEDEQLVEDSEEENTPGETPDQAAVRYYGRDV